MKKIVYILFLLFVLIQGKEMFAQEDSIMIIPMSNGYFFYYDGEYHDYCGRTKYLDFDIDTLNPIKFVNVNKSMSWDTVELANDHYGQECFLYDVLITGSKFCVNVYVPKGKTGLYEFEITPIELQLVEYAVAQFEEYGKTVFLPKYNGLNPSENLSCHDCDAVTYMRLKKDSSDTEYLLHHFADSIPDALLLFRDIAGAIIESHCHVGYSAIGPIKNYSIRKRFCKIAEEQNCPLGVIGDIFITQKRRQSGNSSNGKESR